LPFIAAPPVGVHEQWNLRWATDRGAALPQHDPAAAGDCLLEWLEDGVLASAAEAGLKLPSDGLYEIANQFKKAGIFFVERKFPRPSKDAKLSLGRPAPRPPRPLRGGSV